MFYRAFAAAFLSLYAFVFSGGLWIYADTEPVVPASLYDRLGGEEAIKAVVDAFVARGAANPKVNFIRQGTPKPWTASPENVESLKKHLVQFIGGVTGGPQVYEGKDMVTAHAGMKISHAEFDALAADLKTTLEEFKVPEQERGELLALVDTTRGAIVEEV